MLTATYSTPASDWTRAIDYGLGEWAKHIVGNANFKIDILFDDGMKNLASCTARGVSIGKIGGKAVEVPGAIAKLQGWKGTVAPDMVITVNRSFAWGFGAQPSSGKFWAPGVMLHELGHGLYSHGIWSGALTPYEIWRETQPATLFADTMHFVGSQHLMSVSIPPDMPQRISDFDIVAAAACGVPTTKPSIVYLIPGAKAQGGSGNDVAVWLKSFSTFDAKLTNIERLELRSDNPLSVKQADIYRLYRAAFNRLPDLEGFTYWSKSTAPLVDIAASFVASPEFISAYGAMDRPGFIRKLYQNVLEREPDAEGLAYWTGQTDLTTAQLLVRFTLADENIVGTPTFTV